MRPPSRTLAGIVMLGRHRRDEPMETRLAGELGMEGGRDDVSLAHRDDASVFEAGKHVDSRPGPIDDRSPDEHGMNRLVTEERHRQLRLEGIELAPEGIALDADIQQRQDRLVATADVPGHDDHPGTRPEQRGSAPCQIEDRLAEVPAIDELTHRRALAAGDDEPRNTGQILGQPDWHARHADGPERVEMLAERPLEGEYANPHRRTGNLNAEPCRRPLAAVTGRAGR